MCQLLWPTAGVRLQLAKHPFDFISLKFHQPAWGVVSNSRNSCGKNSYIKAARSAALSAHPAACCRFAGVLGGAHHVLLHRRCALPAGGGGGVLTR